MAEMAPRITSEPDKFNGRPCIRGLRIRVADVLDLLAAALAQAQILKALPDLEREDIKAAVAYAPRARSCIARPCVQSAGEALVEIG